MELKRRGFQGWAKTLLSLSIMCVTAGQLLAQTDSNRALNVVFIGNSITQGAGMANPKQEAPPAKAALYLEKQPGIASVHLTNAGVSGSTTVDWLPATATLFSRMEQAVAPLKEKTEPATWLFSIMLGTNDSASKGTNGCPVSPEQYRRNMETILNQILTRYPSCLVVLNRPLWYSPSTHNGATYLQEGLTRLESYYPVLKQLVKSYGSSHPNRVFMGDTAGFDHFKKHYKAEFQEEKGNSGLFYLHPNQAGAQSLGELWGKAIYSTLRRSKTL